MDAIDTPRTALSGLDKARTLIASGRTFGIGASLDFHLVEVADGFAAAEGVPGPHAYNPQGVVHGGYAATLLDTACGFAVLSRLGPDQGFTTIELKVAYHRAVSEKTGRVRAEGRVLSAGRRVVFTEAKLLDVEGRLLASATSSLMILEAC